MENINISNIKTIKELREIKNRFSCISELISTLIYLDLASSYGDVDIMLSKAIEEEINQHIKTCLAIFKEN